MITIFVIHQEGAGFWEKVDFPEVSTVSDVQDKFIPEDSLDLPYGFLYKVNRESAEIDTVLSDGDRVAITPYRQQ